MRRRTPKHLRPTNPANNCGCIRLKNGKVNTLSKPSTRTKKNEGLKIYYASGIEENLQEPGFFPTQDNLEVVLPNPTISMLSDDTRNPNELSTSSREKQRFFREMIFSLYKGRCVISETRNPCVLQAAHIFPYKGVQCHQDWNGLLLRSDIHLMFDSYQLTICKKGINWIVKIDPVVNDKCYQLFEGRTLEIPNSIDTDKFSDVIEWHNSQCSWL